LKISKNGAYYGKRSSEIRTSQYIISEYDYLEKSTPWHFHESPYFMYVLEGNMLDVNKKRKALCPTGSFLFHNWQDPHFNQKNTSTARGFHIEFSRDWYKENQWDTSLWEGSALLENPRLHHLLGQLYYEFRCNDASSPLSIELLVLQLCENVEKDQQLEKSKKPKWIDDLKEVLNDQTEDLTLSHLSKTLGVHPVHLSRSIPKYFSTTLGDYIRQQKIKKALAYILDTKYSLTEIAYSSGFADQSHFIRCFKRYMGTTPGSFRQKFSKG